MELRLNFKRNLALHYARNSSGKWRFIFDVDEPAGFCSGGMQNQIQVVSVLDSPHNCVQHVSLIQCELIVEVVMYLFELSLLKEECKHVQCT